jgi:D-mannonate dehydratase
VKLFQLPAGVLMAIHPDDPHPILGLPRVVSTEADLIQLLNAIDSPSNGFCMCTGLTALLLIMICQVL